MTRPGACSCVTDGPTSSRSCSGLVGTIACTPTVVGNRSAACRNRLQAWIGVESALSGGRTFEPPAIKAPPGLNGLRDSLPAVARNGFKGCAITMKITRKRGFPKQPIAYKQSGRDLDGGRNTASVVRRCSPLVANTRQVDLRKATRVVRTRGRPPGRHREHSGSRSLSGFIRTASILFGHAVTPPGRGRSSRKYSSTSYR